ncbi:Uncharacterised protein [Mycobacteroides abscessus]|nr:Uncharacterised protein [Mycobacteroides abscessus]
MPIESKKSASRSENTSRITVTVAMFWNEPRRENWPRRPKSGTCTTPSNVGALRLKPSGFEPSGAFAPMWSVFSSTTASTVAVRIATSSAPLTLRTHSTIVSTRPTTNTRIGHVPRLPSASSVPLPAVTKPALTRPMSAMNRPMPTLMAVFSSSGTARKTASRNPVSTSTRMMRPSMTTRPIASAHVTPGSDAIEYATTALRPSPAASPSGKFAKTPMASVMTPATSAVAAAILPKSGSAPPPRNWPVPSWTVPMISGFSTMM